MKTPDRHTCCGKRRATSAPVPHAVSLSRPRFIEPRRPSPDSPPQEVRLNRWHENSKAVFPPTNPAHVPASSPRWRAMQRALKVARARSTVVCSCDALSARASGGALRRVSREAASVVSRLARLSLVLQQAPHRLFQQQQMRPGGPSNRVAFLTRRSVAKTVGHFLLPGMSAVASRPT